MKHRVMTMAGAFALLAVLGKFYAIPAVAQAIRAAVVKNIDEPGRNKYQATVQCTGAIFGHYDFCQAYGTPVPAGSRLVVQNVDLNVIYESPNARLSSVLLSTDATHTHNLNGGSLTFDGFTNSYSLNANLVDYVEAGQTPSLQFTLAGDTSGGSILFGSVTGHLVNLNN